MPNTQVDTTRLLEHAIIGYDYGTKPYTPDRDFFTDAFNAVAAGGLDGIEMVAQALSAAGIPADGVVNSIEQYKASVSWDDPSRAYFEDGARRTVIDILRSASQNISSHAIGLVAGGAIGLATGGPPGMVAGATIGGIVVGGPVYGLSAYYTFMQDAKNSGIPVDTIRNDAILAAVNEGGLEMASDLIFGKVMGLIGGTGKTATKELLRSLLTKTTTAQFAKKFMVSYLKTAATEIPTELAQGYFEYNIRKNAGLPVPPDLEKSLKNTAIVTAGTSAIFAMGGLGGSELRKKFLRAKVEAASLLVDIGADSPNFDINDTSSIEFTEQQLDKIKDINDIRMLGYDEYMKYKEDTAKGRRTLTDMVAIASRLGPVFLWNSDKAMRTEEGKEVLGTAFRGRGTVSEPHPLVLGHEIGHHLVYSKFLNHNGLSIPKKELIAISRLHRRAVYKTMHPSWSESKLEAAIDKYAYNGSNEESDISEAIGDFAGLYLYTPDVAKQLAPKATKYLGEQIDRITRDPQTRDEARALATAYSSFHGKEFNKSIEDELAKNTANNYSDTQESELQGKEFAKSMLTGSTLAAYNALDAQYNNLVGQANELYDNLLSSGISPKEAIHTKEFEAITDKYIAVEDKQADIVIDILNDTLAKVTKGNTRLRDTISKVALGIPSKNSILKSRFIFNQLAGKMSNQKDLIHNVSQSIMLDYANNKGLDLDSLLNPAISGWTPKRISSFVKDSLKQATEITTSLYQALSIPTSNKMLTSSKLEFNMESPIDEYNNVGPEALLHDTASEFDDVTKIVKQELGVTDDDSAGFIANIILQHGGLPQEATARKRYLETIYWAANQAFATKSKGKTNLFNPWVSIRYGFADLETKTGVVGLYKGAKNLLYKTGKTAYDSSVRINKMFSDNGINPSKLADDPETIKQVTAWLYEKDDAKREKIASSMSEYALKVANVVHNELQGETATNIRVARWMMWRTIPRTTLDEYLQLYHRVTKNKASREDLKRYGKLQGYFESILPPDLKPEYGVAKRGKDGVLIKDKLSLEDAKKFAARDKKAYKVVQLTSGLDELIDADKVYEAQGIKGLKEHLSTKSWGTRKHYYMSSTELDNALEQFVGNATNPGILGKHTTPSARPGTKMSEAHTRTSEGIPKEAESFLPDLYNHIQRAALIADTGMDMINLSDKFLIAMPKTRDANSQIRTFKRFVMNAMGLDESAPVATRVVEKVNRFFWRTYPFAISRPLWYTFRNLTQNVMALGQLNTAETAKSVLRLATSGTSDLSKRHFSSNFKSIISQKLPIFRHFMMMEHDVVDKKYKRKMIRLLDTLGQVIPFSDEVNRMILFPVVHDIAERNVNLYKEGKISFDKLASKASLNTLHPQEILSIQDLLRDGKYDEAIFDITSAKVANTHFRYRAAERAGVEQHRAARPLTGLYNWPRGLVEATYYNGVKPFVVGLHTKNFRMAFSGLTSMTKLLGGMFAARELLKKILGKKDEYGAYDTLNTVFGYSPGSAGLNLAMSIFDDFKRAHDYARDGDIDKAFFTLVDRAAYHLPLVADVINAYEANNDRRGVKAMRLLYSKLAKSAKEPGKSARRTAVEKWQHVLFGTEEIPQSDERRKAEDRRRRELLAVYKQLGIAPPPTLMDVNDIFDIDKLLGKFTVE